MYKSYCCVQFCKSISTGRNIHFHRFPRDLEKCKLWVDFCGINSVWLKKIGLENLGKSYRICSLHFEDSMFSSHFKLHLKRGAVPTINVNSNSKEDFAVTGTSSTILDNAFSNLSIVQNNSSSNQSSTQDNASSKPKKTRTKKPKKVSGYQLSENDSSQPTVISVTPDIIYGSMIYPDADNSQIIDGHNQIKEEVTDYNPEYVNTDSYDGGSLNAAVSSGPNDDPLLSFGGNVCRLCLESERNLHPVFSEVTDKQDDYRTAVLSSIPIMIEKNDGLPQCICESCYNALVSWHDFREMCIGSNIILRQYISNMSLISNSKCPKVDDNNPVIPESHQAQSMSVKCVRQSSQEASNNKRKVCNKRSRKEPRCRKKVKTSFNSIGVDNSNADNTFKGLNLSELCQSSEHSSTPKNLQPKNMVTELVGTKEILNEISNDKLLLNVTFNTESLSNVMSLYELNVTSTDDPLLNVLSNNEQLLNNKSNDKELLSNAFIDKELPNSSTNDQALLNNTSNKQLLNNTSSDRELLNDTSVGKMLLNVTSNNNLLLIKTADNKLLLVKTSVTSKDEQLTNVTSTSDDELLINMTSNGEKHLTSNDKQLLNMTSKDEQLINDTSTSDDELLINMTSNGEKHLTSNDKQLLNVTL